jgi:pyruvate/2-oxoglutarate dehydrogenase complex dihydrolipoamide dehydrogenase (E3) component
MLSSASHIWAAGDVVGRTFLETVAAKEGYTTAGREHGDSEGAILNLYPSHTMVSRPQPVSRSAPLAP